MRQNCNTCEARGKVSFTCLTCKGLLHRKPKWNATFAMPKWNATAPITAKHLTMLICRQSLSTIWQLPTNWQLLTDNGQSTATCLSTANQLTIVKSVDNKFSPLWLERPLKHHPKNKISKKSQKKTKTQPNVPTRFCTKVKSEIYNSTKQLAIKTQNRNQRKNWQTKTFCSN